MHIGNKAQKREESAMSVSMYGNLLFVVAEIVMAIYTGSQAVLLDAVYDGVEFVMLLPSLFLIPFLYKPSSERHPFGYAQIETLFVVVKGITMTAVTAGLIFNNIHLMLHGGHLISFDTIVYFELSGCILGVVVTLYLYRKNSNLQSPIIDMELQGWAIDSIVSLGMSGAFLLPLILPFPWFQKLTPYLDQVITVVLSLIMLPAPIRTVITGIRDLLLIPPEEETIEEIKKIVEPVLEPHDPSELYYDIVRTGRKLWISVYVTFEKDTISLSRFQKVQYLCIRQLAETYQDFYFELLPDIEFNGLEDEDL